MRTNARHVSHNKLVLCPLMSVCSNPLPSYILSSYPIELLYILFKLRICLANFYKLYLSVCFQYILPKISLSISSSKVFHAIPTVVSVHIRFYALSILSVKLFLAKSLLSSHQALFCSPIYFPS